MGRNQVLWLKPTSGYPRLAKSLLKIFEESHDWTSWVRTTVTAFHFQLKFILNCQSLVVNNASQYDFRQPIVNVIF